MNDFDDTDPTFVDDLEASKAIVWRAARWLSDQGMLVTIQPTFVRPTSSEMADYADVGDLQISQTIEVKHRPELEFTTLDEIPWPTIIVDTCHHWDRARPKPYGYMIFNAQATVFLWVSGKSRRHWNRVPKKDKKRGRKRTFYECPLQYCKLVTLADGTQCEA